VCLKGSLEYTSQLISSNELDVTNFTHFNTKQRLLFLKLTNCSYFQKNFAFDNVSVFKLTRNMRVEALGAGTAAGQDLAQFSRWLLDIGEGSSGERVKLPEDVILDYEEEVGMIDDIFPDLAFGGNMLDAAILMPLRQGFSHPFTENPFAFNRDVNRMNATILHRFPGELHSYLSADYFEPGDAETEGDSETYPPEFLHSLEPDGLSVHQLDLKLGAPVNKEVYFSLSPLFFKLNLFGVGLHQEPVSQDRAYERDPGCHHRAVQALR
jgi:hypothetical protein